MGMWWHWEITIKLGVRIDSGSTSISVDTVRSQKNSAVSKVNKKFISHLTRAQRTPSAAATV
jgi:hypothetical protein